MRQSNLITFTFLGNLPSEQIYPNFFVSGKAKTAFSPAST